MIWSSRDRNRSCSLVSRRSRGRIANRPVHQLEREESWLAIRGNPQNRFARKSPSKGQKPANSITWAGPIIQPITIAFKFFTNDHFMTAGQLEIKQFIIPGWDSTSGSVRRYPGHTRVNHTKYIVTDRRINIGTSNMTWDYFASTAGSSFNADHPTLVRTLQSVFDRDWASSYAWRLT